MEETMIGERYYIDRIDYATAMAIVRRYHYLHRIAPCSMAFGLFERSTRLIVGCVTYGVSSSSTLLRGICGDDEMHNVYELTRLWIKDGTPKNAESYLVGNTLRCLDKEIIVSFAEKDRGHVGTVYQACNFLYCGLTAPFKDPVLVGKENMHHSTFAHGMTNDEIKDKWGDDVVFVERPRKYRYVYFNARGARRKCLLAKLRYPILPYPKKDGMVADTVDVDVPDVLVAQQLDLFDMTI